MNTPSDNQKPKKLRQIYEPRYGRKLSDKEVWEIEHNLKAYTEVILQIASLVYDKTIKFQKYAPQ
jgi:hypothetical protein